MAEKVQGQQGQQGGRAEGPAGRQGGRAAGRQGGRAVAPVEEVFARVVALLQHILHPPLPTRGHPLAALHACDPVSRRGRSDRGVKRRVVMRAGAGAQGRRGAGLQGSRAAGQQVAGLQGCRVAGQACGRVEVKRRVVRREGRDGPLLGEPAATATPRLRSGDGTGEVASALHRRAREAAWGCTAATRRPRGHLAAISRPSRGYPGTISARSRRDLGAISARSRRDLGAISPARRRPPGASSSPRGPAPARLETCGSGCTPRPCWSPCSSTGREAVSSRTSSRWGGRGRRSSRPRRCGTLPSPPPPSTMSLPPPAVAAAAVATVAVPVTATVAARRRPRRRAMRRPRARSMPIAAATRRLLGGGFAPASATRRPASRQP